MSHLRSLPVGSMLPRPQPGYSTRRRVPLEGADLETLDAEVKAAGGWIERTLLQSKSLRADRVVAPAPVEATWYVIPTQALEA